MFLSTFEKQLDLKRRIVVPQEFRAAVSGPRVEGIKQCGRGLTGRRRRLLPPGRSRRNWLR